jgi:hypothetical protein
MIAVALDLFLVLVARRLDFHLAWTVPEFLLPLAVPTSPDAILALDLPLELPALGFALHLARTVPELVLPLATPPSFLPALVLPTVSQRRPEGTDANDHQNSQHEPCSHLITSAET